MTTTAVYFGAEERHGALAAGADGLITKPVASRDLVDLIRRLLRESRRVA